MDNLKVNIFTGVAKVIGFNMRESNDSATFVKFDTLEVDIKLLKLLNNNVYVSKIKLVSPIVNVLQNGKSFNFDDIISFFASKKDTVNTNNNDTLKSTTSIDLHNIAIRNGNVVYKDLQLGSDFDLKDIALDIPQLFFSGQKTDLGLNLKFANGGDLMVNLLYAVDKGKYNLNAKINEFTLSSIYPYIRQSFNISKIGGTISADISVDGEIEHVMNIVAKGKVEIDSFLVNDIQDNTIASLDNVNVELGNIDLLDNEYDISNITIAGLHVNYVSDAGGNTLSKLFVQNNEEKTLDSSSVEASKDSINTNDGKPLKYNIRHLSVASSSVNYSDQTMIKPFSFEVNDINAEGNNISSATDVMKNITLNALAGHGGEVKAEWKGMDMANQSFNISLKNIKVADFSPYCMQYTCYPIESGLMSFSNNSTLVDNNIKSENKLELFKCIIGKKQDVPNKDTSTYINIPVRAAINIIEDMHGKIKIDLPVSGNITNPKFSYKKTLLNTLAAVLLKAVASPVNLITKSLGKKEDVFDDMMMLSSATEFTNDHYGQLNQLVEIIKAKPETILTISQSLDTVPLINNIPADKRVEMRNTLFIDYFKKQGISEDDYRLLPVDTTRIAKHGNIAVKFGIQIKE